MTVLFYANAAPDLNTQKFSDLLRMVGAHDADVLYVHSGMAFGIPNPQLKRAELLGQLYAALRDLKVKTLCMPTYTFSFCNGEIFDVAHSPSRMGALSEFVRKQPGVTRSVDPLMSTIAIGEDLSIVNDIGHESCGRDSTFDLLSHKTGVKFLFLGVRPGDCFTYMHYLEWREKVPYRYDRPFTGTIRANGQEYQDTYYLFTRYQGVIPGRGSYEYEQQLILLGSMKKAQAGSGNLYCVSAEDATALYCKLLQNDANYFLNSAYDVANRDTHYDPPRPVVAM